MTGITIKGTGSYLPEHVVTNDDFTPFIDTSDEWIVSHTGISKRRIAIDEPVWYMGAEAAKAALDAAGIATADVDVIIGTTVTPDYYYPSMSCLAQNAIGAVNAFAFDVAAACTGFVCAIDLARRHLQDQSVRNVLIISAESLTQVTDYTDRGSCVLFGDGAAACVIGRGDGIFGSYLRSDASGVGSLYAKHRRKETPFTQRGTGRAFEDYPTVDNGLTVMDGHEVYRFATKAMPVAVRGACEQAGIEPTSLDLMIPHQANIRIIKTAAKNLKLPMDNIYVNIQDYGNTSSASIPIALDECVRSGRLHTGDTICVVGFGAGLTYGACTFTI